MTTTAFLFMALYFLLLAVLACYGIHRYWILYLYFRHYKWARPARIPALPEQLPFVTVQLPVFNERYVVERLLDAAAALDYPKDRLEIQVLDDSTDDTTSITGAKVEALRAQGFIVEHVRRAIRIGFKAGALSEGLARAKGEFVAIFDADFVAPADFLKRTLPYFADAGIGMVQTRWGHLNENHSLLTAVQSVFLDGHFLLEHTARNRSGAFFNFNGTAGIWRRQAIETSGGWQHDTLTEDLDLSYRAQMHGWRFVFLPEVVCPAELPVDINAFKTQQNRWTMGAIQTARKMLPSIWRSDKSLKVKIEATFHLTGCMGYVLMAILSVLLPLSLFFRSEGQTGLTMMLEGIALTATTISVGFFYAVGLRDLYPEDWRKRLFHIPLLVAIGTGICLSNSRAIIRGLWSNRQEFKRTPKYSVVRRDKSWKKKKYRSADFMAGWVETAFALYFLNALVVAIELKQWISVPFILLFGFGYAYVAWLSFQQNFAAWRPRFSNAVAGE